MTPPRASAHGTGGTAAAHEGLPGVVPEPAIRSAVPPQEPTASRVLRTVLDQQVGLVRAADGALGSDLDSGTNRMYAGLRRLRTTVIVCRPLLHTSVDTVNEEVAWFLGELRPLHHVDVVRQHLSPAVLRQLDLSDSSGPALEELLQKTRRDALALATEAWTSERYAGLSSALGRLLGTSVTGPEAEMDARTAFQRRLSYEVERLRRRAEEFQTARDRDREERFDDLRNAARRAHCAIGILDQVDATKESRARRHLRKLLKLLRERHDSTVTRRYLEQLLNDPSSDKAAAALAARLLDEEAANKARIDRKLPKAVAKGVMTNRLLPGE
jgi:CHAD domain-containing protein